MVVQRPQGLHGQGEGQPEQGVNRQEVGRLQQAAGGRNGGREG